MAHSKSRGTWFPIYLPLYRQKKNPEILLIVRICGLVVSKFKKKLRKESEKEIKSDKREINSLLLSDTLMKTHYRKIVFF